MCPALRSSYRYFMMRVRAPFPFAIHVAARTALAGFLARFLAIPIRGPFVASNFRHHTIGLVVNGRPLTHSDDPEDVKKSLHEIKMSPLAALH